MSQSSKSTKIQIDQNVQKGSDKPKQPDEQLSLVIKQMEEGCKRLIQYFTTKAEEEQTRKDNIITHSPYEITSFLANTTKNRTSTDYSLENYLVVLGDNLPGNYIHASYVYAKRMPGQKASNGDCHDTKEKKDPSNAAYIATQAPKIETVVDFWRMVWQSKSKIIVSLTNLKDLDQGNTSCYWPQRPTEIHRYGPIMVRNLGFREQDTWVETLLEMAWYGKGIRRKITHLIYADWDDKRAPSTGRSVSNFREKMRNVIRSGPMEIGKEQTKHAERGKETQAQKSPIIVHCSTGAGRTGAFITLDMCMEEMEKRQQHDTLEFLMEAVREQLPGAVETQNQFICIYLANVVHAIRHNPNLTLDSFQVFKSLPPIQPKLSAKDPLPKILSQEK